MTQLDPDDSYDPLFGGGGVLARLDPHLFYENRLRQLQADAVGVESLAYKIFGPDVIRSFAFRIDPFVKYKLSTTQVTAVKRTRGITAGVQRVRKNHSWNTNTTGTTNADPSTPDLFDRVPYKEVAVTTSESTVNLNDQAILRGSLKDTTTKTRPAGSNQGEAEFFVPEVHSPPRSRHWVNSDNNTYNLAGGWMNHARTLSVYHRESKGPAANVSSTSVAALATTESALADQAIAKYALGMINDCSSQRRVFTLARNIAELRDLPRTLRETCRGFVSLYHVAERLARDRFPNVKLKGFHKKVANQYLNEKFGWETTVRDVMGLMVTPAQVAKRVNYLILRSGQDTSYRTRRSYVEPIASPPAFSYTPFTNENQVSVSTSGNREVELRCMVNCNVKLPQIEVPTLRREETRRMWGIDPTPVDLYNLVPWSWLVDWFTGLGDYGEAFLNINNDREIINYGLITYLSRGEIKSNFVGRVTSSWATVSQSVLTSGSSMQYAAHTSALQYRYRKRKSITSAFHVKPVWDLGSFSGFQLAILGALLAKST